MSKVWLERRVMDFGRSKSRAEASQYAARAQSVSDPKRRAELLRFSGDVAKPNGAY
jgi:hypothetical protein